MAGESRDNALDHVVVVVFENLSLDNVLGRLYGPGDGKTFEGVTGKDLTNPIPEWAEHGADRKVVPYAVATDMDSPNPDTGEEHQHTNTQLYNILSEDNRFKLAAEMTAPYNAPAPGQKPTMDGFVTDYISTLTAELGRQPTYEGSVALVDRSGRRTGSVTSSGRSSVFAGFRFPREVIAVAVRWYLRYGLSYRDVEELLAERGVTVDHVTIYRWVQRFTPEFIEAARHCRHAPGDLWFADETYIRVAGQWTYLYRAIDQHGQVIDVLMSQRRDLAAARRFFTRALRSGTVPAEVTTDRAPAYPRVLDELIPSALHTVERYANNPVEADHGRLKARLRPMRGLKRRRSARILAAGHAFVQNLRRGHYELATDVPAHHRVAAAFDQLVVAI